eukprot:10509225-Lingulodinium_polyedra.AAC.1
MACPSLPVPCDGPVFLHWNCRWMPRRSVPGKSPSRAPCRGEQRAAARAAGLAKVHFARLRI